MCLEILRCIHIQGRKEHPRRLVMFHPLRSSTRKTRRWKIETTKDRRHRCNCHALMRISNNTSDYNIRRLSFKVTLVVTRLFVGQRGAFVHEDRNTAWRLLATIFGVVSGC
jgi:hypothetical protein